MIPIIYAICAVATFFGMKLIDDFKDSSWEGIAVRFLYAMFAPLSLICIVIGLMIKSKEIPKPPKWI